MTSSAKRAPAPAPRASAPIMRRSISENSSPPGKAQTQANPLLKSSRAATRKPSLNASPRRPAMIESQSRSLGGAAPFANGFQANRSVSLDTATLQLGDRDATGQRKKSSRVVEGLDGGGNKENIAPLRVVSLASPPRRRAVGREGRRAVRIYEVDSKLGVSADAFGGLGIKSPRLHVRGFADGSDASSEDSEHDDTHSDGEEGTMRGLRLPHSPLRLTRTASTSGDVEDDVERVIFRISKLAMQVSAAHDSESSSDEASDADSRRSSIIDLSDMENSVEGKEVSSLFVEPVSATSGDASAL